MFEDPFSFKGRIRRAEYGLSIIIYVIAATILNLIMEEIGDDALVLLIVYIPIWWFLIAQSCKRCHDVGNSGWWQLIPFYGLWLIFQDGQIGPNKYGENPKGYSTNIQTPQNAYTPNKTSSTSRKSINTSGYGGGYSGGHNNHDQRNVGNNKVNPINGNSRGYKDGELYN